MKEFSVTNVRQAVKYYIMTIDMDGSGERITSDPFNSLVFGSKGGANAYIVGGYTRDLLTGRRSRDRDYVVAGPVKELVAEVLRATEGRLIELGRKRLHRIVLKDGGTLDFSPLKEGIEEDLSLRDFTINAIAWSPKAGWIDPQGGLDDLRRGMVRMVDAGNLRVDPIRILRAYRFAAELSYEIEPQTRFALREISFLIHNTKSERITSEFFKILNLRNAAYTVDMTLKDGLLPYLIYCNYRDLQIKVEALYDVFGLSCGPVFKYKIKSEDVFSQGLTHWGLLGLEILLWDLPDHLFALSMRIAKRLYRIRKATGLLGPKKVYPLRREILFDMFEAAGDAATDLLFLLDMPEYREDLQEFGIIQRKGLLTAEEVRSVTGNVSGPALGMAIRAARKAEFTGRIRTAKEAVSFLKSND